MSLKDVADLFPESVRQTLKVLAAIVAVAVLGWGAREVLDLRIAAGLAPTVRRVDAHDAAFRAQDEKLDKILGKVGDIAVDVGELRGRAKAAAKE